MRDAVELERKGIPTVTLSHDNFESAARANAKVLGMPVLPLVIMPRTKAGYSAEELHQEGERVFSQIVSRITQFSHTPVSGEG